MTLLKLMLIGVVLTLCFSSSLFAQDKLSFKDGHIEDVSIIRIDNSNKIIEYTKGNSQYIIVMSALKKYYFKEEWVEVEVTRESILYPVNAHWNYLEERSPWSIGTNLSSLLFGLFDDNQGPLLSDRPLLTFEPEYRFSNEWLSVKGSLAIGIPVPTVNSYDTRSEYNTRSNGIVEYYFPNDDFNQLQIIDEYYSFDWNRSRYVPWEVGISAKLWPVERLREHFFIFGGVMFGQCDYKAITIYDTFEGYDEWGLVSYRIKDQLVEVRNNPFIYTRFEGGLGFNFQFSKRFTLGTDLCITNKPRMNLGNQSDIVFARLENGSYEKVYEEAFEQRDFSGPITQSFLFRFKFNYHFQKQ